MAAAPPGGRELPPPLPEELFEEVLLRLPPDDLACLLRASLVCKAWGCAVSRPGFRRSLHELHRTPPVLGFFHDLYEPRTPHFIPTTASAFYLDAPDWESWEALDCHHGRALFLSKGRRTMELLVWEPITGFQRRVPVPPAYGSAELGSAMYPSAAVLCAADGCDHRDCLGGPFHVVFVFVIEEFKEYLYATLACVYSSETGTWGEPTSMHHDLLTEFIHYSHALVGGSLLYFNFGGGWIVEYDIASQNMTVFDSPGYELGTSERFHLVLTEDGALGVSELLFPHFKLWTREASEGTDSQWVLRRVIDLENLLPDGAFADATRPMLVSGFAEGANVIFVVTPTGLFTIRCRP